MMDVRDAYHKKKYEDGLKISNEAIEKYPEKNDFYCYKSLFVRGKSYSIQFFSDTTYFNSIEEPLMVSYEFDSTHWWTLLLLGNLYHDYQRFDEALVFYEASLVQAKKKYQKIDSYINISSTKSVTGDTLGSIEAGKEVLALEDDDPDSYVNMSSLYLQFEYYKKAELILNRGNRKFPDDAGILANLGYVCLITEQYEKGIEYYDKIEEIESDYFIIYGNRAYCHMMLGDFKSAKKDIKKAFKLNPNNPYAYKYRAIYNIKTGGDSDEICADLNKASELGYSVYDNHVNELLEEHCE